MLGVRAPLSTLPPPIPHLLCQANWNLLRLVLHSRDPGLVKWLPEVPPWQESVMEAQEGKTTHSRPLRGTLCVTGFGSAPVLTSSGSGTQMYISPVVLFRASKPNSVFSAKLFFFLMMTGNKLMAETIRRDGGEEQSNVNLFNMSDRQERHLGTTAKVYCFTLVSFPLPASLPISCWGFFAERILAEIKWIESAVLPHFCDLCWRICAIVL